MAYDPMTKPRDTSLRSEGIPETTHPLAEKSFGERPQGREPRPRAPGPAPDGVRGRSMPKKEKDTVLQRTGKGYVDDE